MKRKLTVGAGLAAAVFSSAAVFSHTRAQAEDRTQPRTPVLVELFTSEGCSSCPPADTLLEKLDASNATGPQAIVLSEHVDYWNHLGWRDPFSSAAYSERQRVYADRLGLDGVYTPQMVVNGGAQFVGSDGAGIRAAIERASKTPGARVQIAPLPGDASGHVRVRITVDSLPTSSANVPADVFLAVAENEAFSSVTAGENGGRKLRHVAVLRSLSRVGATVAGRPFAADIPVKLPSARSAGGLRLIAFVQQRGQRAVLGAAMREAGMAETARLQQAGP